MTKTMTTEQHDELIKWANDTSPSVTALIQRAHDVGWTNGAHHAVVNEWDDDDLDQHVARYARRSDDPDDYSVFAGDNMQDDAPTTFNTVIVDDAPRRDIETVADLLRALDARGDDTSVAAAYLIRTIGAQHPDVFDVENAEL